MKMRHCTARWESTEGVFECGGAPASPDSRCPQHAEEPQVWTIAEWIPPEEPHEPPVMGHVKPYDGGLFDSASWFEFVAVDETEPRRVHRSEVRLLEPMR